MLALVVSVIYVLLLVSIARIGHIGHLLWHLLLSGTIAVWVITIGGTVLLTCSTITVLIAIDIDIMVVGVGCDRGVVMLVITRFIT